MNKNFKIEIYANVPMDATPPVLDVNPLLSLISIKGSERGERRGEREERKTRERGESGRGEIGQREKTLNASNFSYDLQNIYSTVT